MLYSDFINKLEKDPKAIVKMLQKSERNNKLLMLEDYFKGEQWAVGSFNVGETRMTRSGKEEWKKFDDNPARGFTRGELKTRNWIKLIVQVYAKYVRGIESEDVQISVKVGDLPDKVLTAEANSIFEDLNEWVSDAAKSLSVYSVATTKYNDLESGTDNIIMKGIDFVGDDAVTGLVELINPKQIEPVYWNGNVKRGYVRFYNIDGKDARERYPEIKKEGRELLYWEAWYIDDDGKLMLKKFIEDYEISDGTNADPYKYLPYTLQVNEKALEVNFDLDNIEESDVANNIELQDDLNAFLTDLNILYRQIAVPMLKLSDEFIKAAKGKDIEKVKEYFSKINTAMGTILFAPLEKVDAPGTDGNQITFLQDIIDQFYLQNGIPKSVLNSEGIANIAKETLDHLFQSLVVIIGHKRTQITKLITRNVILHFKQRNKTILPKDVEVYFPDVFSISKTDRGDLIITGKKEGLLPKKYAVEKFAEVLGESEDIDEIMDGIMEEDGDLKSELEIALSKQKEDAGNNGNDNSNAGNPGNAEAM
jgi:hypothetical protein